jgi:hypothetical protein
MSEVNVERVLFIVKDHADVEAAKSFGFRATCDHANTGFDKALQKLKDKIIVLTSAEVKLVTLSGLKNLAEWVRLGGTRNELLDLITKAPEWHPDENTVVTSESDGAGYATQDGRLCAKTSAPEFSVLQYLCNFEARITKELIEDDGERITRTFEIEGQLANGDPLPLIRVPATRFAGMAWVTEQWGARAIVYTKGRDALRECIQELSRPEVCHIYRHTGWRKIGGQYYYLTAGGAIGPDGFDQNINVQLDADLVRYSFSAQNVNQDEAVRASLQLFDVGELSITAPLWAAAFCAPLASAVHPAVTLWLEGQSGRFKSTLASLFLSHFGKFDVVSLPSWRSTANQLEKRAFTLKDALFLIDDYAPGPDRNELEAKAAAIVRAQGNLAGRGRMGSDLRDRGSFPPRGLVISTGEQHPQGGESLLARMLVVEIAAGAIDVHKLTQAQGRRSLLPHAMKGYIQWLAPRMDSFGPELEAQFQELRSKFSNSGGHLRVPEALAYLWLGLDQGLRFAEEIGAIRSDDVVALRERCWKEFLALGQEQTALIEGEKPVRIFFEKLTELCDREEIQIFSSPQVMKGKRGAVGWTNGEYFYLPPTPTFAAILKACNATGEPFPVSRFRLFKNLKMEGLTDCDPDRFTKMVSVRGHKRRMLVLRRDAFEGYSGAAVSDRARAAA